MTMTKRKAKRKANGLASRPDFIKHWSEIQRPDKIIPGFTEPFAIASPFSRDLGLARVGIWHEMLPPGRRSSLPHAERDEEEFVFVIEGTPDVWIDGKLHKLRMGDGVAFPNGTGIAHCFINNTEAPVRLMVVGEASRQNSRCVYPLHPRRNKDIGILLWDDAPPRKLGRHDGLPDAMRKGKRRKARRT
jgi:uncharacterized cupin superfamily protein